MAVQTREPQASPRGPSALAASPYGTSPGGRWWVEPTLIAVGLTVFILYALWAILLGGNNYKAGPYVSPFFSARVEAAWWPFSPALLLIWIPLGFRATCYYFRKAYYRSYFGHPRGCAVFEGRGPGYRGETAFPFVLQNVHRFFMYLAVILLIGQWVETLSAFNFGGRFGIGLGSLVLLADVVLLTGYVFGCHSLRHLVGGRLDCFSCSAGHKARHSLWSWVSRLNEHHMFWAWASLTSIAVADIYVRLYASGIINDIRFL